jgi:pimeloyl-ACP methyl ester carboxylesterase
MQGVSGFGPIPLPPQTGGPSRDATEAVLFQPNSDGPEWLRRNLLPPGTSDFVVIDGASIHYLSWDWQYRERPALILVHGFRGHAHWWSFLAPFFLGTHRVAAIDLSGMGDSGHRQRYDGLRLAQDLLGFIERLDLAPATVIGHSYGGSRALRAAAEHPGAIAHAILVDTYFDVPGSRPMPAVAPIELRTYPDRNAAQARFRLFPPQPATKEDLMRYVTHHSVRRVAAGWSWKFDPRLSSDDEVPGAAMLERVRCTVDSVCGELSVITGEGVRRESFRRWQVPEN